MEALAFSCRIYGVLLRRGKVLLTRSRFRSTEFVNFPGGGVRIGEAPMQALLRELRDETGLSVRPVRPLYASEGAHLSTQMPIQIVGIYWLVSELSGKLKKRGNGRDVLSLFWADLKSIPTDEMFPCDREFVSKLPGLLKSR